MTLLVRTLLSLGLAAGPVSQGAGAAPRPVVERPRAPGETGLPSGTAPRRPVAKGPPAASARQASKGAHPAVKASAPAPAAGEPPHAVVSVRAVPAAQESGSPVPVAEPPLERRPGYGLVEQKCGRCHGLEKALNSGFSADDWDAYLKKKYRRAGAGITEEQAAEIGAFLRGMASHRDGG